ncbi:MAG TPA: methylated-DNA--[protein]-cysteine S-methyltransferase [Virgibacillus sp.]|nr:methylated-DNA--[protein]-cysteine S-methyltransferase [Virgibacillus sp.]
MPETLVKYGGIETPVGPLSVLTDGEAILRMDYGTIKDLTEKYRAWTMRYFTEPIFIEDQSLVSSLTEEVSAYFQNRCRTFSVPLKTYGTDFQKSVWEALVNTIPYGETRTYKDIAQTIGKEKAVRAVGGAVNKNPISIIIPCHRVIGTNGKMVGYNGGLDKKEHLLNLESLVVQ